MDVNNSINSNYIFQKKNYNSYQCAAYAIYNLLQYCCIKKIKLKYLIQMCKAQKDIGTVVSQFNATLESIKSVICIEPVDTSVLHIKSILGSAPPDKSERAAVPYPLKGVIGGNPLVILFHWYEGARKGNHYAIIDEMYYSYGQYKYRVINYSFDKPVNIISERELKSMLMPYEDEHFKLPLLWRVACLKEVKTPH